MRALILSSRCTVEQRRALLELRAFLEGCGDTCEMLDWLSFLSDTVSEINAHSRKLVRRHIQELLAGAFQSNSRKERDQCGQELTGEQDNFLHGILPDVVSEAKLTQENHDCNRDKGILKKAYGELNQLHTSTALSRPASKSPVHKQGNTAAEIQFRQILCHKQNLPKFC